jgi:hypothetical protein
MFKLCLGLGCGKNILAFQFYINGIQRNAGVSGLLLGRLEKSKELEIGEFAECGMFIQNRFCTMNASEVLINMYLLFFPRQCKRKKKER